jgi:hypothetical protein
MKQHNFILVKPLAARGELNLIPPLFLLARTNRRRVNRTNDDATDTHNLLYINRLGVSGQQKKKIF